jgi:hypothetical protein
MEAVIGCLDLDRPEFCATSTSNQRADPRAADAPSYPNRSRSVATTSHMPAQASSELSAGFEMVAGSELGGLICGSAAMMPRDGQTEPRAVLPIVNALFIECVLPSPIGGGSGANPGWQAHLPQL